MIGPSSMVSIWAIAHDDGANAIGMRFAASRGSVSVGVSHGGLPPDGLVETSCARSTSLTTVQRSGGPVGITLAPSPVSWILGLCKHPECRPPQVLRTLHGTFN